MDNQYRLSDEEHQQVFEKIKKDFLNNSLSVVNPKVVITGGQPASGKGKLARDAIDEFKDKGGSVIIDPDQLRSYHPKYDHLQNLDDKTSAGYTHHDAKKWSLELIEEATAHKKNIVLDQTSADFDTLKNTVQNFRDKGYKNVELKIMSVPEMTSRQGIYHRYEMEKNLYGTGRFVNVDVHNEIYNKLEKTVERLKDDQIVDKLTVYDRHYKTIEQKDFTLERNREFTDQERQQHEYKWFKVIESMETRFAPLTELEIVRGLQENDKLKLNNQKLVNELPPVDIKTGERMDIQVVTNQTSNLLVAKDGFEKHDGYVSKHIKSEGQDNLILMRQNRDHIELINVTKNELLLDTKIDKHNPKEAENITLDTYQKIRDQIVSLENKVTLEIQPQEPTKDIKLSRDQIINDVRIHLKTEGKLGADFAKSANGVAVARGDYIKLTEAYSQKDGLFKSTELPKGAEVRITGHTSKKGETYATGTYNNREVELKIRNVQASYGDQYQKQYETNPKVKQAVDQKATAQQNNLKAPVTPKAQELSASTPKQDKPSSKIKF